MIKLQNSLQIKKFLRIALVIIIFLQIILSFVALFEYFNALVIQGISTSTTKTEPNNFIRLYNFFEIGIASVIKENIVNICLPLLVYVLLRDRDREILFGEEQYDEITEAVKEGVIEGVDEAATHTHNELPKMLKDNEQPKIFNNSKPENKTSNKETKEINEKSIDSFFSTLDVKKDKKK